MSLLHSTLISKMSLQILNVAPTGVNVIGGALVLILTHTQMYGVIQTLCDTHTYAECMASYKPYAISRLMANIYMSRVFCT